MHYITGTEMMMESVFQQTQLYFLISTGENNILDSLDCFFSISLFGKLNTIGILRHWYVEVIVGGRRKRGE